MNANTGLFYLKNKFNSNRLCIFEKSQKRLLQYAHDEHAHEKIHRTYDLLTRSMFISRMKKLIIEYVTACSTCQLFKFSKRLFYEQLQSIPMPSKSLYELNLNFIIILSVTINENNVMFIVIDRFFKYVKLVSKKKIMSTPK